MKEVSPLAGSKDAPVGEAEGLDLPADLPDRGPSGSPISRRSGKNPVS